MKICGVSYSDLNSENFCDFLYDMNPKPNFWYVVLNKEHKNIDMAHFFKNYRDLSKKLPKETKLILCISGEKIPPNDILKRLGKVMKTTSSDIVFASDTKNLDDIKISDIELYSMLATREVIDKLFDLYETKKSLDAEQVSISQVNNIKFKEV
jgi:hypothetical protein